MTYHPPRRPTATTETQTPETTAPQLPPRAIMDTPTPKAAASSQAPTSCHSRQALPSPTKRGVSDEIAEGSLPKQQRTTSAASGPARPETTTEPPKSKIRITKVTITTKQGAEITAYSSEDITEQQTEKILLEPVVKNTEGRHETRDTVHEVSTGVP